MTGKRKHVNKRLETAKALAEVDPAQPVSLKEIEATFNSPQLPNAPASQIKTDENQLQLNIIEDYLPSKELAEQLTSHLVASYLYYQYVLKQSLAFLDF